MTAPIVFPQPTLAAAWRELFGYNLPADVPFNAAAAEQDPLEPWADHRDADFEALVGENRYIAQSERALEWLERGGVA